MQVPIRKKETYIKPKPDPYLTEAKFLELQNKLARLKSSHPLLAAEVKRLAEMGDFSENAGYQYAKGRLRGLNQRILELEAHLKTALIFKADQDCRHVRLGHRVKVLMDGREKTYLILGSSETDPSKGRISYLSPLGSALIGKSVGEKINLTIAGQEKTLSIIEILPE